MTGIEKILLIEFVVLVILIVSKCCASLKKMYYYQASHNAEVNLQRNVQKFHSHLKIENILCDILIVVGSIFVITFFYYFY